MQYKLIASDMDGTLLNDKSELTERTKTAIIRAVEAGVLFVAATGRAMSGVEFVNALFDADMPFITLNGAVAIMGKSRRIIASTDLDFDLAKETYELGVSRGVSVIVWTGDRLWGCRECEDTIRYQEIACSKMTFISDFNELKGLGISKVLWIDTWQNIEKYRIELVERYKGILNCFPSRPVYLEFVSIDADKGIALEEIAKATGIDRSEIIAVGDGYNDVSMLKYAGLGFAMANAPDDVKAACGRVALSNNEDGVADVIERYILS